MCAVAQRDSQSVSESASLFGTFWVLLSCLSILSLIRKKSWSTKKKPACTVAQRDSWSGRLSRKKVGCGLAFYFFCLVKKKLATRKKSLCVLCASLSRSVGSSWFGKKKKEKRQRENWNVATSDIEKKLWPHSFLVCNINRAVVHRGSYNAFFIWSVCVCVCVCVCVRVCLCARVYVVGWSCVLKVQKGMGSVAFSSSCAWH